MIDSPLPRFPTPAKVDHEPRHASTLMETIPRNHPLARQLLNPNWAIVEKHFGCEAPAILKEYYADPERILRASFDLKIPRRIEERKRINVATFTPINKQSVEHFEGYERYLEIASDLGEGLYFIDPTQTDPEVFLFKIQTMGVMAKSLHLRDFGFEETPGFRAGFRLKVSESNSSIAFFGTL